MCYMQIKKSKSLENNKHKEYLENGLGLKTPLSKIPLFGNVWK